MRRCPLCLRRLRLAWTQGLWHRWALTRETWSRLHLGIFSLESLSHRSQSLQFRKSFPWQRDICKLPRWGMTFGSDGARSIFTSFKYWPSGSSKSHLSTRATWWSLRRTMCHLRNGWLEESFGLSRIERGSSDLPRLRPPRVNFIAQSIKLFYCQFGAKRQLKNLDFVHFLPKTAFFFVLYSFRLIFISGFRTVGGYFLNWIDFFVFFGIYCNFFEFIVYEGGRNVQFNIAYF